jgi:hypothetical protein
MPNGGYPKHLLVVLPKSDLALRSDGFKVEVVRRSSPKNGESRPSLESIGAFSSEQIGALVYHLKYWRGSVEAVRTSRFPYFTTPGCFYDY